MQQFTRGYSSISGWWRKVLLRHHLRICSEAFAPPDCWEGPCWKMFLENIFQLLARLDELYFGWGWWWGWGWRRHKIIYIYVHSCIIHTYMYMYVYMIIYTHVCKIYTYIWIYVYIYISMYYTYIHYIPPKSVLSLGPVFGLALKPLSIPQKVKPVVSALSWGLWKPVNANHLVSPLGRYCNDAIFRVV